MKTITKFGIGSFLAASLMGAAPCPGQSPSPDAVRTAFSGKVDEANRAGESVVSGKDGWLFFVPELRYLSVGPFWGESATKVSHASKPEYADPLPAILDFKAQLDKEGVGLLVVPVPGKAAIYPDKVVDNASLEEANRVDAAQSEFLKILESNGVKTLDLTPLFLQYRKDHPDQVLYSKEDTHWSGTGIAVASDAIAAIVRNQPWYDQVEKFKFTQKPNQVNAQGDLPLMMKSGQPGPETFALNQVQLVKDGTEPPITPDRTSPLIILGDSHNLIYSVGDDMLAKGSGLPENLSARIGFVPDVIAVKGSGASPARVNLRRRGTETESPLKGKKYIIWCFTSREFTEGQGWRKVPLTITKG